MNLEQKKVLLDETKSIIEQHANYLPHVNRTLGMKSPDEMIEIATGLKKDMVQVQKLLEGI